RHPSRNKPDAIEPQTDIGFLCKDKMPDVRRIKCPAQNTVASAAWHPEPLFIQRNALRLPARAVPTPTMSTNRQEGGLTSASSYLQPLTSLTCYTPYASEPPPRAQCGSIGLSVGPSFCAAPL